MNGENTPPEELIRFIARNFGKVGNRNDISILEVGCGPGANIWFLAREGYRTFGIDGSEVAINKAKEMLKRENLKAELFTEDILNISFSDGKFDCVIDIECLYANSLKDSKLIIKEIERVLKPGGVFLSKTFMTGTFGDGKGKRLPGEPNTYEELYESALYKGYGIIRFTSEKDITELYGRFEIINIDYIIRSEKNRAYEIKEWLITCRKRGSNV